MDSPSDPRVRLHVVTGKGGTGKTTVAAALALALASRGKQVLLCEVEGRQGIAQLFDVPPLPYEERRIASGPAGAGETEGGEVYALAIEPEAALLEYLAMYYRLGRAGKALDRFGVIDFATTIAPGVRDVLLTGKVYEAVRRRRGKTPVYDAVVLDVRERLLLLHRLHPAADHAGELDLVIRAAGRLAEGHTITGPDELVEANDHGSITEWRLHLGMVAAAPWGPYAQQLIEFARAANRPEALSSIEGIIEFCREWSKDHERDQIARILPRVKQMPVLIVVDHPDADLDTQREVVDAYHAEV